MNRHFNILLGFWGPIANHTCITTYKPVVGCGNDGYNKILECFKSHKIGGFARVVVVCPLHTSLPCLVLVVCATCNYYDSLWVRKQWGFIDHLREHDCKDIVGSIVGHSNDGDSHQRQLILEHYRGHGGGRLSVEWLGWLLTTRLDRVGDALSLHDQNFIHNGKKLVNPLDFLVCVLQLGGDICALEHLGLIYTKYTYDQHGLKLEDVQRSNCQNRASAQRIFQQKMRTTLALLQVALEVHQECTFGTEMYLQICGYYTDNFLCPMHDLRSRGFGFEGFFFFFIVASLV